MPDLTGRVGPICQDHFMAKTHYRLGNAEERAELHPGRFVIPDLEQRRQLGPEFLAKLLFELEPPAASGPTGERMWVAIEARTTSAADGTVHYRGRLRNTPQVIKCLQFGDLIHFEPRHIADYEMADDIRPETPPADLPHVVDPYGQAGDPKRPS
jgi:hypothetical protein